jgi:hypothetical protein
MLLSNKTLQEIFKDTKGLIRSRKSNRDRQNNGQKTKDNRQTVVKRQRTTDKQWSKDKAQQTNNDIQNTIQKFIDWTTRTPLIAVRRHA